MTSHSASRLISVVASNRPAFRSRATSALGMSLMWLLPAFRSFTTRLETSSPSTVQIDVAHLDGQGQADVAEPDDAAHGAAVGDLGTKKFVIHRRGQWSMRPAPGAGRRQFGSGMTDGTATGHAMGSCTPRSAGRAAAPPSLQPPNRRPGSGGADLDGRTPATGGRFGSPWRPSARFIGSLSSRIQLASAPCSPAPGRAGSLPREQGQDAARPELRPEAQRHHPPVADPPLAEQEPERPGRERAVRCRSAAARRCSPAPPA